MSLRPWAGHAYEGCRNDIHHQPQHLLPRDTCRRCWISLKNCQRMRNWTWEIFPALRRRRKHLLHSWRKTCVYTWHTCPRHRSTTLCSGCVSSRAMSLRRAHSRGRRQFGRLMYLLWRDQDLCHRHVGRTRWLRIISPNWIARFKLFWMQVSFAAVAPSIQRPCSLLQRKTASCAWL